MAAVEQVPVAEVEQVPVAEVEQVPVADAVTPCGGKRKSRAAPVKGLSLEAVAAKIKRLQEEAEKAEALAAAKQQEAEDYIAKMEACIEGMRAKAAAARAEAQKTVQSYARMQHEEELVKLESSMPKRPNNPFLMFTVDIRISAASEFAGLQVAEVNKKISELWKTMSEEKKKTYKDKFDEENKAFKGWEQSEEGLKISCALNGLRIKIKASEAELVGTVETKAPAEQAGITPPKKQRLAQAGITPPSKAAPQRLAFIAKPAATVESSLDQNVMLEAEKIDLVEQLRNLVGRPDVRALGKTDAELLGALRAKGGMVNAAKRFLLGEQ